MDSNQSAVGISFSIAAAVAIMFCTMVKSCENFSIKEQETKQLELKIKSGLPLEKVEEKKKEEALFPIP